jgi:hypothetical protein
MKYITIKVLLETRHLLRLIAAHADEQMMQALHRICVAEWERVKREEHHDRHDT